MHMSVCMVGSVCAYVCAWCEVGMWVVCTCMCALCEVCGEVLCTYLFIPTQKPEEDNWVIGCLPLFLSTFPFF